MKIQQTQNYKITQSFIWATLLSLPFERIFSFSFADFTVKLPYIVALFLIIVFFVESIFKKQRLVLGKTDKALFLFVFFNFLSVFWSLDKERSLILSLMILFSALIFFVVRRVVEEEKIEKCFTALILIACGTSILALWQFWADSSGLTQNVSLVTDLYVKSRIGFTRVQSTFLEPGFYASFLLMPLFLNIYKILKQYSPWYYLSLLLISLAFCLTYSRGGLYAILVALFLTAIIILIKFKSHFKRFLAVLIVIGFSYGLSVWLAMLESQKQSGEIIELQAGRVSDIVSTDGDYFRGGNLTRGYTIRLAFDTWKHQAYGIGMGAFGSLPELSPVRAVGNLHQTVNSLYPEMLVEVGIQGLFSFILFLATIFYFIIKRKEDRLRNIMLALGLFALFVQYLSMSTLYLVYVWYFLGISLLKTSND